MTQIVDAEGNTTQFRYDAFNRLIEIQEERPDGPSGSQPRLVTSFTYDRGNNRTSEVDPAGRVTTYHYDPLNRLIALVQDDVDGLHEHDAQNPVNRFDVNADGLVDAHDLSSLRAANGDVRLLPFDPRQQRPDYLDVNGDGAISTADDDAVASFLASADANSDGTVDVAEIRAAGITPDYGDLGGRPITIFEYDRVGNRSAMIDANGQRTEYRYDPRHRLIEVVYSSIEDEMGNLVSAATSSTQYDAAGQVVAEVDTLGRQTRYEYDDAGRLTKIIAPDAGQGSPITVFAYDLASNRVRVIDPLLNETTLEYDARDRLIRVTEPDPSPANGTADVPVTEYAYDAANRQIRVSAAENRVTQFVYDDLNRLIAVRLPNPGPTTDGDQPVFQYAYDRVGNRLGQLDPEGNLTRFRYDADYRLTAVIGERPDGNAVGRQVGLEAAFGGEPLDSLRTNYPVTEFTYDAAGNRIQIDDPLGRQTRFAFDQLHRPTTTAYADPLTGTAPDPRTLVAGNASTPMRTYAYDLYGNVVAEQDAVHDPRTYAYDAWHRVVAEVDENGDETGFRYDLVGNPRFLVDPAGNTTEWQYDALDRQVLEINPQQFTRGFAYDLVGNLVQKTDRNGRVTVFEYDDLYRMTHERWYTDVAHWGSASTAPLRDIAMTYDTAGRLIRVSDPAATYNYTYDYLDRVTDQRQQLTGLTSSIQFTERFDRNGLPIQTTATIGGQADAVTTRAYDNRFRLTSITQQASSLPAAQGVAYQRAEFAYDFADQRLLLQRQADSANGPVVAATRYEFDQVGRIAAIQHADAGLTPLAGYTYQYTADSRIAQLTSLADATSGASGAGGASGASGASGATGTVTYGYDERGQLTSEAYDFVDYRHARTFDYDQNGNRQIVADYDGPISPGNLRESSDYQTPTNNRLTDDGVFLDTYDAEGNRLTRRHQLTGELTEYQWDHRNRLVAVTTRNATTGDVGAAAAAPAGGKWAG